LGANFERGRATAARPPSEPLQEPSSDWSDAVKILADLRTIAYSSLQRVEARINPLLGGTLAAIALSFDRNGTVLDLLVVLLYFIPLHALVSAYLPRQIVQVPDAQNFVRQWELTPRRVTRTVAYALADALHDEETGLSALVQRKAARVKWAIWWLYGVTALVIFMRLAESYIYASIPLPPSVKALIAPRVTFTAVPSAPQRTAIPSPQPIMQPNMKRPKS
jgi:phage shock protein PspC (stress-responsive transcriptional regulator)